MSVKKPKKPVPYSRQNWNTREDYEQAVRIYEGAMAIYVAAGADEAVNDLVEPTPLANTDTANPPTPPPTSEIDSNLDTPFGKLTLRDILLAHASFAGVIEDPTITDRYVAKLEALITDRENSARIDVLERAWGIIANAGAIWDSVSAEAAEWRELAWQLEKDFYDLTAKQEQ